MITIQQIKAARALLAWNQEELAHASGISKPALANLERGKALPRVETLEAIMRALQEAGIEFIEGPGVRLRSEILQVRVFEGAEAIFQLWDDQLKTLHNGGVRLISGVDERLFDAVAGKRRFREMMKKFAAQEITSRILQREGDTYFVEPVSHYRWVSPELFMQVPYFIYGDTYAIFITQPHPRIVLIENKIIAESYRKQFNAIWEQAKPPVVEAK